jgi:hypothetical protein
LPEVTEILCIIQSDTEHPPGVPYDFAMEVDENCRQIIGIWSFGMLGEYAHKDMGFRIGRNGYKRGVIQVSF